MFDSLFEWKFLSKKVSQKNWNVMIKIFTFFDANFLHPIALFDVKYDLCYTLESLKPVTINSPVNLA